MKEEERREIPHEKIYLFYAIGKSQSSNWIIRKRASCRVHLTQNDMYLLPFFSGAAVVI
jgi:hypothetical protein